MRILFTGDSITCGNTGVSFVKIISQAYPHFKITNLGKNGDTFNSIAQRTIKHLESCSNYDLLIVQGGYNDILLPTFNTKNWGFKKAYQTQLQKGQKPSLNKDEFYLTLKKMITGIKKKHSGKIIITTMGCINETTNSKVEVKRNEFNAMIKQVAEEEDVLVADVAILFDSYLSSKKTSNFCLENFFATAFLDKLICKFKKGACLLSKKRKLYLTIDGVHLNKKGAMFFSECLLQLIY